MSLALGTLKKTMVLRFLFLLKKMTLISFLIVRLKFINTLTLVLKYLAMATSLTQKEKILSVVTHGESVKVVIVIILLLLWEM